MSAIGNLFKPKTSPTPGAANTAASTRGAKAPPATAAAPGGGNGQVWLNSETHVYHKEGSRFYGRTKKGKYVTEQEAQKEGARAAKE